MQKADTLRGRLFDMSTTTSAPKTAVISANPKRLIEAIRIKTGPREATNYVALSQDWFGKLTANEKLTLILEVNKHSLVAAIEDANVKQYSEDAQFKDSRPTQRFISSSKEVKEIMGRPGAPNSWSTFLILAKGEIDEVMRECVIGKSKPTYPAFMYSRGLYSSLSLADAAKDLENRILVLLTFAKWVRDASGGTWKFDPDSPDKSVADLKAVIGEVPEHDGPITFETLKKKATPELILGSLFIPNARQLLMCGEYKQHRTTEKTAMILGYMAEIIRANNEIMVEDAALEFDGVATLDAKGDFNGVYFEAFKNLSSLMRAMKKGVFPERVSAGSTRLNYQREGVQIKI